MKILTNSLLLTLGMASLTCTGRAQTMVGGSESLSLDTTTGDVTVESGWYRDGVMRLWLSTRWDESSQGVLTVNGNEYAALSSDEEKECTVSLPAHSSGTYVCEWAVDGLVYRRTLVSQGARRVSVGGVLALDTRKVHRASASGQNVCYDVQWAEGAAKAVVSCNGKELVQGVSGVYRWIPEQATCTNVFLLSLQDADGLELAQERASFILDSALDSVFALIDDEIPWTPGLFDACENIREVSLDCDLTRFVADGGQLVALTLKDLFPSSYASLTNVVLGAGVTVLPDGFFDGCRSLANVTFPATLKDFGESDWRGLGEQLGKRGLWFENDWVLGYFNATSSFVGIPNGIKQIASRAFEGQSALEGVAIPSSVTNIGANAFVGCTGIRNVTLNSGALAATMTLKELFPDAYANLVNIELGTEVTVLADGFFDGCLSLVRVDGKDWRSLGKQLGKTGFWIENGWLLGYIGTASTSVAIPEGVTGISSYAFEGQSTVQSVVIPAEVTTIGGNAFAGCTEIRRVELRSVPVVEVKTLKDLFPDSCASLTNVVLGVGVTALPNGFFDGCEALENVTFPATLKNFGNSDWRLLGEQLGKQGLWVENDWVLGYFGTTPERVVIPEGVLHIVPRAFEGQDTLMGVSIPASVTNVGANAFAGCSNVVEATIGCDLAVLPSIEVEGLVHRWSFNGDLTDSIGGQTAVAHGSVVCGEDRCTLAGGSNAASYIDLGDNILPVSDAGTTIEIWGTRHSSQSCSRVIDINSGTSDYLFWGWQNGGQVYDDSFGIAAIKGHNDLHSGVPFEQDVEYHLSIVIQKTSSYWTTKFVKRGASTGEVLSICEIDSSGKTWSPSSLRQTNCWLGRSAWSADCDANASYNEVRVWNRALTDDELSRNAALGPDSPINQALTCKGLFPDSYANLTNVVLGAGVTELPDGFFEGCVSLKNVAIPSLVTALDDRAFAGCSNLVTVTIPSAVTNIAASAFVDCPRLRSVELHSARIAATKTLKDLFPNSYMVLTNVVLDAEITVLADGFFDGCNALVRVDGKDWRDLGAQLGKSGFWIENGWLLGYIGSAPASVEIPNGVTGIAAYAFEGQPILQSVVIPVDVKNIGTNAFARCTELRRLDLRLARIPAVRTTMNTICADTAARVTDIALDEKVTRLAVGFFEGCTGVRRVELNSARLAATKTLKEFFPDAYADLTDVVLGAKVTKLAAGFFDGCVGLRRIELDSECVAKDTTLRERMPDAVANLTEVVLGSGVTAIPDGFFEGCDALTAITIPETLEDFGANDIRFIGERSGKRGLWIVNGWVLGYVGAAPAEVAIPAGVVGIASFAFEGQSALEAVSLPSSLRSIGVRAFALCTSLERLDLPDGVARIDNAAFQDCTFLQELSLPSGLKRLGDSAFANCTSLSGLVCAEGLVEIGAAAFSNCWRMLSVSVPASLETVGENAFFGCSRLTGATVPTHVKPIAELLPDVAARLTDIAIAEGETALVPNAFAGCAALARIALPPSLTEIPDGAFRDCAALASIAFPSGVVRIGDAAFAGCAGLSELALPPCLTNLGTRAFAGLDKLTAVAIPPSVTVLGTGAFAACPNVRSVSLPGNVATMADVFPDAYASALVSAAVTGTAGDLKEGIFADCRALKTVTVPTCVTNIGARAFRNCAQLEPFALWEGLVSIGAEAFYGVETLLAVTIPDSVTFVGADAFGACPNIRSVTMPVGLCSLASVFSGEADKITSVTLTGAGTEISDGFLRDCAAVASVTIPEGVTAIGADAFKGTSLASVEIPSTVTTIGAGAFAGLDLLTELTLPAALQTVGDGAFADCARLASLVVPAGVTALGANVFDGCAALKAVSFLSATAPATEAETYAGAPDDLVSYVVKGSTGWDGLPTSKALPQLWPEANGRAIEWWEPNVFEVTFLGNGGEPASQTVAETTGATYVLPSEPPVRAGATFTGWWTEPVNGGQVKATTKVELTRPHTLYAHWRGHVYTLAFDLNGAAGALPPLSMEYGEAKTLPSCPVRRRDFDFAGWALSPDGAADFADGAEVRNLTDADGATVTLYAVWTPRTWTLSDYLNAGGLTFASAGDAAWLPDAETSHDGDGSLRSGVIGTAPEGETVRSTLKTSVTGKGVLSFWWKVDCEPGDSETGDIYDYLELTVDGVRPATVQPIAGDVDWTCVTVRIDGDAAAHEVCWSFVKDDWDEAEFADVAWVDAVTWTPDPVTLAFDGNGATGGDAPEAIVSASGETVALPGAGTLVRDGYGFVGWDDGDRTYAAGAAYVVGAADVAFTAVWRALSLGDVLNAPDFAFAAGGDAAWTFDASVSHDGVASLRSGAVAAGQESWVETSVTNAGTLAFWWKADGLLYRGKPANYVQVEVDGQVVTNAVVTDWTPVSVEIAGAGAHTVRWTYVQMRTQSTGAACVWLDEVAWTPAAPTEPTITGDTDATVMGDAETGFVVKPSAGTENVVVEIPNGVDAATVTVVVAPDVKTVTPNGAAVKVVRGAADITDFLDIPAAVDGVVDLGAATVKAAYANEPLDTTKSAVVDLSSPASPSLTTAPTRAGLVYTLREGMTLEALTDGDRTIGNGQPWTPKVTVKGGTSGFYSIRVSK